MDELQEDIYNYIKEHTNQDSIDICIAFRLYSPEWIMIQLDNLTKINKIKKEYVDLRIYYTIAK